MLLISINPDNCHTGEKKLFIFFHQPRNLILIVATIWGIKTKHVKCRKSSQIYEAKGKLQQKKNEKIKRKKKETKIKIMNGHRLNESVTHRKKKTEEKNEFCIYTIRPASAWRIYPQQVCSNDTEYTVAFFLSGYFVLLISRTNFAPGHAMRGSNPICLEIMALLFHCDRWGGEFMWCKCVLWRVSWAFETRVVSFCRCDLISFFFYIIIIFFLF